MGTPEHARQRRRSEGRAGRAVLRALDWLCKAATTAAIAAVVSESGVAFAAAASGRSGSDAAAHEIAPGQGSVRIPTSLKYDANFLHRWLLGTGYRALWSTPTNVEMLDLEKEAGGLVASRRFGGQETPVLAFDGADGASYTFRGIDKDPSAVLAPKLRETFLRAIVQDQMAAQYPGGALVADQLTQAAGVLGVQERRVALPDDPRLGEFRDEFAGLVGTFYRYPNPSKNGSPGYRGALEIVDYEELYARLEKGEDDEVAVEDFLRARLVDILVGDFDRHRKQWRWARFPGDARWHPLPEDRDMAFVRFDGAGPRVVSFYVPILQNYGDDYPAMIGLTLHGWEQDRWLLPRLEWSEWQVIALDLQRRLDDATIDAAIALLPPEFLALDGERLRHDLRGRRDRLLDGARLFYEHLAAQVDVQLSAADDAVEIEHAPDGTATVVVDRVRAGGEPERVFERRFLPDETDEVRVYLRGGNDRVRVVGEEAGIRLRLIAGKGSGEFEDSGAKTLLYDEHESFTLADGSKVVVDRRPYKEPETGATFVDVKDVPPRDWGSDLVPIPGFAYEKDVGVYLGVGGTWTNYGFRKNPWSSRHEFSVGWAFEARQPRARYKGLFRPENSPVLGRLDVLLSGIETLRFYGFGNGTKDNAPDRVFRVNNQQYRVSPGVEIPLYDDRLRLSGGPWVEFSDTRTGQRLINTLSPYGSGSFGSIGAVGRVQIDTRRTVPKKELRLALPVHRDPAAGYPLHGFLIDVSGAVSPPVWDVKKTWGYVEGSAAVFGSAGDQDRFTLALRAGGKQTFGRTPYFDAASIGGGEFFSGAGTVRGYRAQRFTADASAFANAELRVFVMKAKIVFPGEIGFLVFSDVGRVFEDGESSESWHPSVGGGLWFAPLARTNAISLVVADSVEETLAYLRFGFHF